MMADFRAVGATFGYRTAIAEGNGRFHCAEYAHHAGIARGSLFELVTCLDLAGRLGYPDRVGLEPALRLADPDGRMLTMLIRALRRPTIAPR